MGAAAALERPVRTAQRASFSGGGMGGGGMGAASASLLDAWRRMLIGVAHYMYSCMHVHRHACLARGSPRSHPPPGAHSSPGPPLAPSRGILSNPLSSSRAGRREAAVLTPATRPHHLILRSRFDLAPNPAWWASPRRRSSRRPRARPGGADDRRAHRRESPQSHRAVSR